jgi:hypothetical protein
VVFLWEKTTKGDVALVCINCETATPAIQRHLIMFADSKEEGETQEERRTSRPNLYSKRSLFQ